MVTNVEALKEEPSAPEITWYAPHIIPYVKSYQINSQTYPVLASVDHLFNWYNSFVSELNQNQNDPALKAMVDSITEGAVSDLEKAKAIFYWTQNHIKYIAIEYGMGGFIPRPVDQVCQNRYGDCKDMASTITGLLRYAGIDAYLTWVGTTSLPYRYEELPTPNVDNHMIATYIDTDGQYYFLDATGRYSTFNIPSSFIQGKEALIRKNDTTYEIVTIPLVTPSDNKISEKIVVEIDEKDLQGSSEVTINGYQKTALEYYTENKTESEKIKFYSMQFTKGHNKFALTDYTESNHYPEEKPLIIDYSFRISDYVLANENELYINLNSLNTSPVQKIQHNRKTPVQHEFPAVFEQRIELIIPEGWIVDYLPENMEVNHSMLKYTSSYELTENRIHLFQNTTLPLLNINPDNFANWNEGIKDIVRNQKEIVILKKYEK